MKSIIKIDLCMQSQDKGKSKCILADLYLFPAAVRLLNKTFFTCALCIYGILVSKAKLNDLMNFTLFNLPIICTHPTEMHVQVNIFSR